MGVAERSPSRLARMVGILFIVASLSAVVGGSLVLPAEESDSVVALGSDEAAVVTGILVELLLVAGVVGIAALLFPVLRRCSEGLALAYLGARLVEGLLLAASVSAMVIVATRQTTYQLGPYVAFGVSALILYWLLYRSRLVPVWLIYRGFAGATVPATP